MLTGFLAALLYVVSAVLVALRLFHHKGLSLRQSSVIALVAIALHLVTLSNGIFVEPGQNMSMTNVASLVAWLITLAMTLGSLLLGNVILLPVVYGFSALIIALTLSIPDTYIMHIEMQPALVTHITLALFAYGCLSIAFLYAVQLAYINFRLKHKRASMLTSSLPPLMAVESILFKIMLVGTVLLTLSLLSGFVFLENMFANGQAHKTVLSIIAWIIFCITLVGHQRWGWRGKPVISATVAGSILLTLAYFGSRFVREVLINT